MMMTEDMTRHKEPSFGWISGPIGGITVELRACTEFPTAWMNSVSPTTRPLILIALATVGLHTSLCAQTVQLPTYRVFQMPLNVVVPDGGTAVIGGTKYSAASQSTRSLPLLGPVSRQRTLSRGSKSISVSATIIDHREWDAAVLAEANRGQSARPKTPQQLAAERMTQQIRPLRPMAHSVADIAARAQRIVRSKQSREEAEALELIRHGEQCLAKGQIGAARIFFRTAMRQSSGAAHQLAQRQLNAMTRR
jgi:hypothetical protein